MAFAVSCLSEGLLLVDGERVERLDHVPSAGLAVSAGRNARALRTPSETATDGEVIFGARSARVEGLVDPHELAWDGDLVAGVATLANAIRWFDQHGRVIRSWRAPGEGDCWHLSGITVREGSAAVSAFGRFGRHRDWAERNRHGTGFVLELPSGRVLLDGLSSPHSPRFVDDTVAICDSGRGDLVVGARRVHLGGWTRGVAVTRGVIAVGVSVARGKTGHAQLALVRRSDLQVVRRIPLPVREVFDVVELSVDRARSLSRPGEPAIPLEPLRPLDLRAAIEAPRLLQLRPGALANVRCIVTNRGTATLRSGPPYPIALVSGWKPGGRALWSPLPAPIAPGAAAQVLARLLAPCLPGQYTLELRLVQERVGWLEGAARADVLVA